MEAFDRLAHQPATPTARSNLRQIRRAPPPSCMGPVMRRYACHYCVLGWDIATDLGFGRQTRARGLV